MQEPPDKPDVEIVAYRIDICRLVIVAGLPRTIETLIAIFVDSINGFSSWVVPAILIQVVREGDLGCNEAHYVKAASDSDYGRAYFTEWIACGKWLNIATETVLSVVVVGVIAPISYPRAAIIFSHFFCFLLIQIF